jgi:AbrB family looped-hinge helix DNA binding protein
MAYAVGPKGQVVISKELRDRLGVKPGWIALERLVDDHIELYFVPPPHHRSLKGSLAPYLRADGSEPIDWDRAREAAWEAAAREKEEPFLREPRP